MTEAKPQVNPTELWVIACAAWNNVTPEQMAAAVNKDIGRMPEGARKAWDRVFKAVREAQLDSDGEFGVESDCT